MQPLIDAYDKSVADKKKDEGEDKEKSEKSEETPGRSLFSKTGIPGLGNQPFTGMAASAHNQWFRREQRCSNRRRVCLAGSVAPVACRRLLINSTPVTRRSMADDSWRAVTVTRRRAEPLATVG